MANHQIIKSNPLEFFGHQNIPEESKSDIWLAKKNETSLKEIL